MQNLENYQREKKTINLLKANLYALLVLLIAFLLYGLPYYLLWKPDFKRFLHPDSESLLLNNLLLLLVIVSGIILHEVIHGITFALFAKNGFKAIKFGVLWKMLTPYCHCKEPLKLNHYILGALMPSIILGFIPAVISILISNLGLLVFAVFFTAAGTGDFTLVNLIRRESKNSFIQDHASEVGFYIYRPIKELKS